MKIKRKNRIKVIRSILEGIFLIVILWVIIKALFSFKAYEAFNERETTSEDGIVAISYFGVDRNGDSTLISTERLEEHLEALKKQGYVTITQEDIKNNYKNGKLLPEKALFLMFEDGRRDTAIFAQKLLEKYNYKASIMTYAEKFEENDPKFLQEQDLKEMLDSTYWELGTNGYRLFYINVFDRYNYYLGELSTLKFAMMSDCLGRDYNHYLMDYIRDANRVPKESYKQMEARISADYEGLKREYEQKMGVVPKLYVLMHANTGRFGNNKKVSNVNSKWIHELFEMNFNREGDCWNTKKGREDDIYNLTRMQPQPYWYSNHLLMRIKYDSEQDMHFINGNEEEYKDWNVLEGALECKEEKLVVTSIPEGDGRVVLKNSKWKDFELSTTLTGNLFGSQILYLRADDRFKDYISVSIENNVLYVREAEKELYELNLDEFDGIEYKSVEEDEHDSRLQEMKALLRYADDMEEAEEYKKYMDDLKAEHPISVEQGSEIYIPDININELGKRKLKISIHDKHLTIWVDDRLAAENIQVSRLSEGSIALGSRWGGYGWSQRNIADDVYDGVFEKLTITTVPNSHNRVEILYDNCFHGVEKFKNAIINGSNQVINWFIKYL